MDDWRKFLEAEGVRPLKAEKRQRPRPEAPSTRPRQRQRDDAAVLAESLQVTWDDIVAHSGEEARYLASDQSPKVLKRLSRADFVIEAQLDLHGLKREEAARELATFLDEAHREHWRCLRIIHGKGVGSPGREPVLKRLVPAWLSKRHDVIAFCSARPVDGGSGALYVLLRKGKNART